MKKHKGIRKNVASRPAIQPAGMELLELKSKYFTFPRLQGRVVRKPVNVNPGLNVN